MENSIFVIVGGLFIGCIIQALRDALPSNGDGVPSSPCPPQGYTWQAWQKKIEHERPLYWLAALLLAGAMVYMKS